MGSEAVTDSYALRKARGAFFTPPEVTRFIVEWAIRTAADRTLEPSCGEADFMVEAGARLRRLGADGSLRNQLHGVEMHAPSASAARDQLVSHGFDCRIDVGDFFGAHLSKGYDAVVGNPPYVRYQDFAGEERAKAREAALAGGVRLSGLASSWAAFVVRSACLLAPDGRLGLVLPAELLSVNYAGPVRRFLTERFARVRLVMFEERVFPGVLEEVVLLLAEGEGPAEWIEVSQTQNLAGLADLGQIHWSPEDPEAKWTAALLPTEALHAYTDVLSKSAFVELEAWGATDLGMVTGNNRYFTLSPSRARDLGIPPSDLMAISPPGSRHLRGLTFSKAAWKELAEEDRRVHLFLPPRENPAEPSMKYIRSGNRKNVSAAYKCRVREPWWRVPTVGVPHLFLTYMNHDTPRLVTNEAGVGYVNSVHGVTLKKGYRVLGRELLPIGSLNSLTLLGAELVGRSYGGGLLKLEPKEADVLPVPSPDALRDAGSELRALAPHLAQHLRKRDLQAAVEMVDGVLLARQLGLTRAEIRSLREAREALFARRSARAGKQP
jgi:adenine-specific DNA-methyltransferase